MLQEWVAESKGENDMGTLKALNSMTLSGLVAEANELGIQKENIVSIMPLSDMFVMLYYE